MLTPSSIQQCQHASVTVTVAVTCPAARPIHLIVAVDRSRSIEPLLATVRRSARDILAELDWAIPGTQVAVLSHGFKVTVETDWTNQASRAQGALNGIRFDPGDLGEDPPLAIDTAARMFERARTDADGRHLNPIEVLVLYGDGCDPSVPSCPGAGQRASGAAAGQGIQIATVCFDSGPRASCGDYRAFANPRTLAYSAPAGRLPDDVRAMQEEGRLVALATVRFHEILPFELALVAESALPVPTVVGQAMDFVWVDVAPGTLLTATYQVTANVAGTISNRVASHVVLEDTTGRRSPDVDVPSDRIEVLPCEPPTPTPLPATATRAPATASATSMPTATESRVPSSTATNDLPTPALTPQVGRAWLPVALRGGCLPRDERTDVVLVIDASSSMGQMSGDTTKIVAAKDAARTFVALLQPDDRAAVIAFDVEARVMARLTRDGSVVDAAIAAIVLGEGTRIDRAIDMAVATLPENREEGVQRVIVLLTDGRATGSERSNVLAAAARAHADRQLYAIGLGEDVDRDLLRAVASTPDHFREAPTAGELRAIYTGVVDSLPCPGGAAWTLFGAPPQPGRVMRWTRYPAH